MSTPPVVVPKLSWLKKVGQVISHVLHIIVVDGQPVEKIAVPVAEALLPQFIPMINFADGIFSNIVKEAVNAEAAVAAAGTVSGGPQKLTAVLRASGPFVDAWVAANFPMSKGVSLAAKTGLINSIVAIINEVDGGSPVAP